jgi:hypothetical protein
MACLKTESSVKNYRKKNDNFIVLYGLFELLRERLIEFAVLVFLIGESRNLVAFKFKLFDEDFLEMFGKNMQV